MVEVLHGFREFSWQPFEAGRTEPEASWRSSGESRAVENYRHRAEAHLAPRQGRC